METNLPQRASEDEPELSPEDQLLSEIYDFLEETGMGPSYFGKIACRQSELINRLKRGGRLSFRTARAVRDFMAERRQSDADAARGAAE